MSKGTIEISVEFDGDLAFYDFSGSRSLAATSGGLFPFEPPPGRIPATISMRVVTPEGGTSDILLIRNYEFWNAFDPKRDYVAAHTFDLGKSGKVSELVYLKPTATPITATLSRAPANPRNVPSVPGTAVLISVIDEQGRPVEEGKIEISVKNQGFPQWDFAYALDLSSLFPGGLLPLDPPSGRVPATVSIRVVTPTGEASDTLVIGGDEFWQAVGATDLDYVAVHEFDLAKSGTTSSVVYTTEPQSYPQTEVAAGSSPHPLTPTDGPQQASVVDAEVDDGRMPSDAREAERSKLQAAIDSMMADRGITNVDVVAIAANVWTSLPTGVGSAPLAAAYLRQAETQYFYCWDATSLTIEQHEVPMLAAAVLV